MSILIKQGRVIDPANKRDGVFDLLIEKGKIVKIEENITDSAQTVIKAQGKIVSPGLVDMHVHLREPGREDKETVSSGTLAAAKGGVTSVLAMPNTEPAIDSESIVNLLASIIKKDAKVKAYISAAITKGRDGKKITDFKNLKKAGAIAVSDDGCSVDSKTIMLKALEEAKKEDILVICHCEDHSLSKKGVMNKGFFSTKLGLCGISKESEYKMVARDIELAKKTGARIHIAHVSCKESVEIIAKAKAKGIRVSAETAPHYFSLIDESVSGYDTNMKMNPPLRGVADCQAIKKGLADGAIDAIASDHAPHTINEKAIEFDRAAFGVVGLETELAVAITELIDTGMLTWLQLIAKMSLNPSRILNLNQGSLGINSPADVIVISPDKEWVVEEENIISQSKNSSFLGKKLKGLIDYTICQGKIVYQSQ